ncbi:MAG: hypothetical protein QXR19_10125 [Candidatus Jordarchaeaceae archaeon]
MSAEKKVRTLYGVKVEEYKTERGTFRQIGGRIWTPEGWLGILLTGMSL